MATMRPTGRTFFYLVSSFVLLLMACIIRFIAGLVYSNSVLVLEGFHALIDAVISFFILLTVYIVRSEYARKYPYGLYRLEDLAALVLSIIILFTVVSGIEEVFSPPPASSIVVIIVQLATIPLLLSTVFLKKKAGQLLRSPSLIADAVHMLVDVIESSSVAIGLILYLYTGSTLVYTVTAVIALLGLIVAAYEAGHDSLKALLDLPREKELPDKIKEIIRKHAGRDLEVVDIKARWAGPVIFVEILLRLHPLKTIDEAGRLCQRLASLIKDEIEGIEDIVFKLEPATRKNLVVAIPVEEPSMDSHLSDHFAKAKYFIIAEIKDNKLIKHSFQENPVLKEERETTKDKTLSKLLKGARLAEHFYKQGVTDIIILNIGEIAHALLLRHNIIVWKGVPEKTAKENLELLLNNMLERLREPTHEASWEKYLM